MEPAHTRILPFSGIGIGAGIGIGCGAGIAAGVGGTEIPGTFQGFGFGGGCGIGLGIGWGFFLAGIGTPVRRLEDILGTTDRQLDKAMEQINRDRAAGKRPHRVLPEDLSTGDEFLDKVIRAIIVRREKLRTRRGFRIQHKN